MKLYGNNSVIERLKCNPQSIKKIYIQDAHRDLSYIRKKADKWGIPLLVVPLSKVMKLARSTNTQGVLVEIDDFEYAPYSDLCADAAQGKLTLVFLDGIMDPQNLGVILRSLACLGRFGIVLPTHHSVSITDAVLRVACGGENFVRVAQVGNLASVIDQAKEEGIRIAGTVITGGSDVAQSKLDFPLALVVGSEHKGVRDVILKKLDVLLTIPMAVDRMSLNVAQAVTIFAYEIIRQKTAR
jgi:23S rRNA (guanosine2251-2'-O)-methyltransferase